MTREEAIDILYGIKADNLNLDDIYTKDKYDALTLAIKALEQDISDDGTLTVNVEDGNKVSRVLVCGDNHFGGLYYPEQEPKIGHWIEHEHNGILHIECSECSSWFLRAHLLRNSYCPNCGCRMVEPQKSEDKNDNSKRSKGMKRKYNWHCYQCGNKQNQKQFNKQNNFLCSKCKYANKAERSDKK